MTRRATALAVTVSLVIAAAAAGGQALGATAPDPDAARAAEQASATGDGVTITEVDASRFPQVRVALGADDVDGEMPDLRFFEAGQELTGVSRYNGELGNYEDRRRSDIMLVLDTSLSMRVGTRLEDAVSAANELIDHARPQDRIGLATFGGNARVVVQPTTDRGDLSVALAEIELANRTTMFDAVSRAAQAFEGEANRAIVLLSDGTDAGSVESLDEAAGEALKAGAPIYAVAIREDADDQPQDLAALGNGTGGELRTVADSTALDSLFDELGRRLLQPYWIEYRSGQPARSVVTFGVATGSGAPDATMAFRAVASSAVTGGGAPRAATPEEPLLPLPGGLTGVFVASLPFALLVFLLTLTRLQARTTPNIIARIERYTAQASDGAAAGAQDRGSLLKRLAAPLLRISESFLGRSAFFDRLRYRAEQASIAIRPAELFTAMIVMGVVGMLLALMLGHPAAFVIVPVLFYLPAMWLRMKARRRRNAFENQLPDVLQGIASSLQAGHSFNQAINAMIKDVPSPTSEELSRVMTEARLGMPLEEALQHMADRMGSADFDFAVTTVNIQRTVGGSLAEILQMVGDTVRNRQQFRKKVKALTSMGQMSAYVLIGMPIFIGAVLTLLNAEYMAPLFFTSTGHMLLAAGTFSMVLGYVACMKVVSVKV